jgi:hypothetical protein
MSQGEGAVIHPTSKHLKIPELVPLASLARPPWRRPLWGPQAPIPLALVISVLYFIVIHGFPLSTAILTVAFLLTGPLTAGVLFVLIPRQDRDSRPGIPTAARR